MGKKNIILIGFMGCGKSTFGKKISKEIGYAFIDMDTYIERQEGCSISEIFATKGEECFRQLESNLVEKLSGEGGYIISTGGGVVKNPKNIEKFKENGVIVYLKSSPERIYRNVKSDNTRPLLAVEDKMARILELLKEREPLYKKYSDVTVDVSNGSISNITKQIISIVEEMV